MALADELLDSISEEQFAEYMLVEENPHIVIDEDRNIILPERYKIIAAQGDHDMTTYTFDCPRFSDGRDMSKMVVYINYIRSDGETGSYPADNVSIDAQNNDLMHFEWKPLLPATIEHGAFAFLVCVCRTEPDGSVKNHWSTRLCKDATISEGMDCHKDTIINMYPDVITRILERLNVLEDGGTTSVQYTVQDLEEEQKVQARKNIEAADAKEVSKLSEDIVNCLAYKTYIAEATDFDAITDVGIYNVISDAINGSTNYPSKNGGILTVKKKTKSEYPVTQELIDTSNVFYTRYRFSTGWTPWKSYVSKDDYDALKTSHDELKKDIETIEYHIDGVGALVDIAESYFNVAYNENDQLLYESSRGLFNSQVADDNGVKSITCSQFVQACISGILYENSRYVKDTNERKTWGFVSDGSGQYSSTDWNAHNDYMKASEQARYFENLGLLKNFDVNRNALKAGDLLFYTSDDSENYKKINHVAICLGASEKRHTIMHANDNHSRMIDTKEASIYVATFNYSAYKPDFYVRSPISAEYKTELIALKEIAKVGTYSESSAYIDKLTFDEPLPKGFYTLDFDDLGDSLYGYIKCYYENGTSANYDGNKKAGNNNVVFYAEMPITQIDVRVATGTSYNCSSIKLYKGYHA